MSDIIYWTMKNGQKINVDEMSESHLRNTLKMIIRNQVRVSSSPVKPKFEIKGDMAQQFHENFPATEDDIDDIYDDMQGEILWGQF